MARMPRGAPAKGSPPKGSWGDCYVIESTQHSKRVSCSCCVHYCDEDKSCMAKPIYVPSNGYNYWRICNEFELAPEYGDDIDYVSYVERIKGDECLPKKKNLIKSSPNSMLYSCSTYKDRYALAKECLFLINWITTARKNEVQNIVR